LFRPPPSPPLSTLFPYTTLFRSHGIQPCALVALERGAEEAQRSQLRDQLLGEAVLLEALLDRRQHLLIHQPRDRVLHHPLLVRERAAHSVQIQRVERGSGRSGHGALSLSQGPKMINQRRPRIL